RNGPACRPRSDRARSSPCLRRAHPTCASYRRPSRLTGVQGTRTRSGGDARPGNSIGSPQAHRRGRLPGRGRLAGPVRRPFHLLEATEVPMIRKFLVGAAALFAVAVAGITLNSTPAQAVPVNDVKLVKASNPQVAHHGPGHGYGYGGYRPYGYGGYRPYGYG